MSPEALMELLFITTEADTPEKRARVAWRACDHMWRYHGSYGILLCRQFNNLCQEVNKLENWPWVKDLWSEEEAIAIRNRFREPYDVD